MKRMLVFALVLLPIIAHADRKPVNPLDFQRISGDSRVRFDVSHYCHLGVVYAFMADRDRNLRSSTVVWDVENDRPYHCEQFEQDKAELLEDYDKETKEYYRRNPPDRMRPNRHTRP